MFSAKEGEDLGTRLQPLEVEMSTMHQVKRSSKNEPAFITTMSSANDSLSPKNKVRGFNITLQQQMQLTCLVHLKNSDR